MALRNHLLLGNRVGAASFGSDCSSFQPGKPSGTRAQRLAVRRSVLLWGATANLDSASATDLFSETASGRATNGGGVGLENRLEKVFDSFKGEEESKRTLEFVKYHGIGNDFIMVNNLDAREPIITPAEAIRLCDRHTGIGGDGVIFVMRDNDNYQMRIYNSDGTEPEMCGNGIRCVAKFLAEVEKATAPKSYKVLTLAGYMILELREDGQVCVDMGPPYLEAAEIPTKLAAKGEVVKAPLVVDGKTWLVTCVSMGNPHCITFGEEGGEELNVDALPLEKIGPVFEHHEMFPARTNTEFVEVISRTHLKMRVWERGAGATQACGTGACALVVAGVKEGRAERSCTVDLPGGPLEIEWRESDNHIYMTGPAERVFQGSVVLDN